MLIERTNLALTIPNRFIIKDNKNARFLGFRPNSETAILCERQILSQKVLQWRPHPGPQEQFHLQTDLGAYETLFGGTKGPGKTDSILREGLRQVHIPGYRAIIFRRTYPRLGEIIDRSFKYFAGLGATFSSKDQQIGLPAWTFKSGAKYAFGHCQNEQDKYNYQGKEFHYMGFDQIEEFTESQFLFLMAQNRTSDKAIKCYIRATANPGGIGHAWVKKRYIDSLVPGQIKYFKRVEDEDIEVTKDDTHGISRSFIPASVYDNPSIIQNDPQYLRRLEQLPETDKQALLYGNWEVFKGQFFKMWRKYHHVIEHDIHPVFKKFISLDYGYGAPSCALWWQVNFEGHLHAYRELYQEGLTYEQLARKIKELTHHNEHIDYCVADPAIWGDKSHHTDTIKGESGAETMAGVFRDFTSILKADNDRIIGWGRLRILLDENKISFSPRCKNLIRTLPTLIHDEVRVEDLDTDGEDHASDSARYGVMSRTIKSEIPKEVSSVKSLDWFNRLEARLFKPKQREAWEGNSKI